MKIILFVFLLFITRCVFCQSFINPEDNMNTSQIISFYGYPCEIHRTTTADGYILTMQRIPSGKNSASDGAKPVVFLQHGLLDSSFTWVANLPNQSLGFILADLGYDVWLGNTRGNVYSRSHKTLSSTSNAFWDFTWDEMAKFDLPAMINYVLSITNQEQLSYVGHSQGNEIAFAKLSENTDFNRKFSSFVALAPVAYIGNTKSIIKYLSLVSGALNVLDQLFNHGEFLPDSDIVSQLKTFVCKSSMSSGSCHEALFLLNGYDTTNINKSRLSVFLSHIPAGTSSKNIAHYAQSSAANKFQMYDFGYFGNLLRYRRLNPPTYGLNTYGVPVAIFYGGKDKSATPIDVNHTISDLGSSVAFKSYIPNYSHVDLIWANNAVDVVYKDLIKFIGNYQ